jgi:hypothetical protein
MAALHTNNRLLTTDNFFMSTLKQTFRSEGAGTGYAIWSKDPEPVLAILGGPFRANRIEEITQGKPWAMISWPLRATESNTTGLASLEWQS